MTAKFDLAHTESHQLGETMTEYQNDATAAFIAKVAEIRDIAEKVLAQCDDHFGVDAEDVKWGNVGDCNRILAILREVQS